MAFNKNTHDVITDIPSHRISFDVDAFDEAVRSQGVKLVHYPALQCPVGMSDLDDNRKPHPDHEGCTNGFIYTKRGTVTALFTGNSKHKSMDDIGFWDGSTVQVTFPRYYDDPANERLYISPFDRFYLEEESITVPAFQRYFHHESRFDRFKYPAVTVQALMDNAGIVYRQDVDFKVVPDGRIEWLGTKRPAELLGVGPGLGNGYGTDRGAVCAVRYLYRPFWYVGQVLHEIRVTQITDNEGDRHLERMPQSVMLHREYVALTKDQNTAGAPGTGIDSDAMRTVLSKMDGGFGSK